MALSQSTYSIRTHGVSPGLKGTSVRFTAKSKDLASHVQSINIADTHTKAFASRESDRAPPADFPALHSRVVWSRREMISTNNFKNRTSDWCAETYFENTTSAVRILSYIVGKVEAPSHLGVLSA